ncbi:hypothetical protein [Parendozoicomonas sp. Alg238-R29]|uniref:hypothetical protein n=1 Tax=Parendozoicomonas sp. Alg238-R29 TaxID=2993446 RepID=UPI00248DBA68|nr:hypothetical protein [Parendozoicomonas sp. Alg238-R29]
MKHFPKYLTATVLGLVLSPSLYAEVQPLEGEQMEDVYIMSTVTVRPTDDSTTTPYYDGGLENKDGGKPSIGDIQRQASSAAVSRDLEESLDSRYYLPPEVKPNFEQRLASGLQQHGLISGDDAQLILNQLPNGDPLPTGATATGSNGNYTINTLQGIGFQTSPTGLTIVLPNNGNFPSELQGGPDSPISLEVNNDQIILQLNGLE